MNIMIANRLIEIRKRFGYSQEELAEKLGLSRQSVSKWERSEASPDTDNLIELAKIYGVTIDDLLNTDKDLDSLFNKEKVNQEETKEVKKEDEEKHDHVSIDRHDIHVESDDGDTVHIDGSGIHVNDKEYKQAYVFHHKDHPKLKKARDIFTPTFTLLITIAYLVLGFTIGDKAWSIGWTGFLLIPIVHSIFDCFIYRRFSRFNYAFLVTYIYCLLGFLCYMWHPCWVLFVTIPVFYIVADAIDKAIKGKEYSVCDNDDEDK